MEIDNSFNIHEVVHESTFYVSCLQLGEERIKKVLLDKFNMKVIRLWIDYSECIDVIFEGIFEDGYEWSEGFILITPNAVKDSVKLTEDLYLDVHWVG